MVRHCPDKAYVYVLRLFDDHYYVGVTKWPKRRVISHARGESVSPRWVKMYPPVEIESMIGFESREKAMEREDELTLELARHHGATNVRGGKWTAVGDASPVGETETSGGSETETGGRDNGEGDELDPTATQAVTRVVENEGGIHVAELCATPGTTHDLDPDSTEKAIEQGSVVRGDAGYIDPT